MNFDLAVNKCGNIDTGGVKIILESKTPRLDHAKYSANDPIIRSRS
jgi:hypothetical protein